MMGSSASRMYRRNATNRPRLARTANQRSGLRQRSGSSAAPVIDPNYLAEESDAERLIDGLEVARTIAAAAPFDGWRGREVLPGTGASMAPGFGTAEELAAAKAAQDYWARPAAT